MNTPENDLPEEELIKRDKIFDNEYDQIELESSNKSFSIDESYKEPSIEDSIDVDLVKERIYEEIAKVEKYQAYLQPLNGEFKKIGKAEINEIYSHLIKAIGPGPRIEIYSCMSEIYEISPDKFYESLSNKFKTELVHDLKSRGYLQNIKALF
jgi:hypothetical protein